MKSQIIRHWYIYSEEAVQYKSSRKAVTNPAVIVSDNVTT